MVDYSHLIWSYEYNHCGDVIMGTIASQITSLTTVYSTVYSDADQRKHQSSASLAFVRGIHRGPVNSPHKGPVARKMFPFDDVTMITSPCPSPSKSVLANEAQGTNVLIVLIPEVVGQITQAHLFWLPAMLNHVTESLLFFAVPKLAVLDNLLYVLDHCVIVLGDHTK